MRVALCLVMVLACVPMAWGQAITGFVGGTEYDIFHQNTSGDVVGYRFTVSEVLSATHLGVWNNDAAGTPNAGLTKSMLVGVWNGSGSLISYILVTPAGMAVGDWIYTPFVYELTLNPGETYTIGAYYKPDDVDYFISDASTMTTAPEVTWSNAANAATTDLGFNFPASDLSPVVVGHFGPNFIVDGLHLSSFETGDPSDWSSATGYALETVALSNGQGYDFSEQTAGGTGHGDFYFSNVSGEPEFWANNPGMEGLVDLGVTPGELWEVDIPFTGYERFGVEAILGHTYVARAEEGEVHYYIIFRVQALSASETTLDWIYTYRPIT